jgi:hypothetical protein
VDSTFHLPPIETLSVGAVWISKFVDSDGCAHGDSPTFSVNDAQIYLAFEVWNYPEGVTFTSQWQGNQELKVGHVTTSGSGVHTCLSMSLIPNDLKPGQYQVTLFGPNNIIRKAQFSLS